VSEVFCNNCGHRNPLGANFCSSCGAILETVATENTTITFHPSAPADPVDEEFSVDIDEVPHDVGMLVVKRGPKAGSRYALETPVTTAGRHPESNIFLDDITVSRRHAEFRLGEDGRYSVCDTGSLNGTYLNRERIENELLANGDEVQIGKFKLVFFQGAGDE
jgi:pSer/pThr/pTyr-binding forkhead associated (FHA) protein